MNCSTTAHRHSIAFSCLGVVLEGNFLWPEPSGSKFIAKNPAAVGLSHAMEVLSHHTTTTLRQCPVWSVNGGIMMLGKHGSEY